MSKVDAEIQMAGAPFQDGSLYVGTRLEPRPVSIEGEFRSLDPIEIGEQRQLLQRVFNPKLGLGMLYIEQNGVEKEIEAVPDGSPDFPEKGQDIFQKFVIDLICPDPYLKDIESSTEPSLKYRGLFKFPLEIPTEMGELEEEQTYQNDGDVPTPVIIEIRGPAVNPKVTNRTTGEYIKVNREVPANQKLIIDTSFGKKRVEIEDEKGNRSNAFNWIDLKSKFFQLQVGENKIVYSSDPGSGGAIVAVRWRSRYVGI